VATCLATSRLATGVLPETSMETTPVETWRYGYQKWLLVLVTLCRYLSHTCRFGGYQRGYPAFGYQALPLQHIKENC